MSGDDFVSILTLAAPRVLGRAFSDTEVARLRTYRNLLVRWNAVHRMVGSVEPAWVARRLVLDSLLFLRLMPSWARDILDVGSGAGVPGLILKICSPELRVTLVEAKRWRASFLAEAVRTLALSDTRVIYGRLEDEVDSLRGRCDVAVARCASPASWVFANTVQLLRRPGMVILTGPETAADLPVGNWVEIDGVEPGTRRQFGVLEVARA